MTTSPNLKLLFSHPAHYCSLGFGSGLFPKAPGTAGSLAAIPLYFLLPGSPSLQACLVFIASLFAFGVWCCGLTGKALGVSDHSAIVWDEMVAMWLILALIPHTATWIITGFLLFRLFDIWKPFPIRQLDAQLKGGFGVMFDDLLAAIYALAVLKALLWMTATS